MNNKTIFQQVFDKHDGVFGVHRLTGIPVTTLRSIAITGKASYSTRLLFNFLLIAGVGTIKAAAKRVAEN